MESELELNPELTPPRTLVPKVLRLHPFLTVLVVGALVGGGLRFVPSTANASSGAGGAGQTACAAK
jgi:hypothetical protein